MNNELYHHGVEGMQWGKRNGPPYPLNTKGKASLAKQKKHNRRFFSNDQKDLIRKNKLAKALKISLFSSVFNNNINTGMQILQQQQFQDFMNQNISTAHFASTGYYLGLKSPLKKKTTLMTDYDDVKYVNPLKYKNNCVCCGITYEMRRRGYDVTARDTTEYEMGLISIKKCFPEAQPKISDPIKILNDPPYNEKGNLLLKDPSSPKTIKKMQDLNELAHNNNNVSFREDMKLRLSAEKNTRGVCLLEWEEGCYGHCINYSVDNKGRVSLIDGQTNSIYIGDEINYIFDSARLGSYIRLDSSSVDTDAIKGACKNYGK